MIRIAPIAFLLAAAGVAHAQIVVPPSQKEDGFKNVAPPQATPDPKRQGMLIDRWNQAKAIVDSGVVDEPVRLDEAANAARLERRKALQAELADIEFESLVERDENGRVLPLERPKDYLALERNPLLADETVRRAAREILRHRQDRLMRAIVINADLMQMIDEGAIDRATISNRAAMDNLRQACVVFMNTNSLGDDLDDYGIVDERQDAMHWRIVAKYDEAARRDLVDAAKSGEIGQASALDLMVRYHLREPIGESIMIYQDALRIAGDHLVEIGEQRPPEIGQKYAEAAVRASQATSEQRLTIVRELVHALPFSEKQELLRAAWALR
ncbi:MAG: hypothetical protein H6811_09180 [Phycisphaeraceae bacterium]|nr:hypothetical protein [Phycisphaeraceae bacterium]